MLNGFGRFNCDKEVVSSDATLDFLNALSLDLSCCPSELKDMMDFEKNVLMAILITRDVNFKKTIANLSQRACYKGFLSRSQSCISRFFLVSNNWFSVFKSDVPFYGHYARLRFDSECDYTGSFFEMEIACDNYSKDKGVDSSFFVVSGENNLEKYKYYVVDDPAGKHVEVREPSGKKKGFVEYDEFIGAVLYKKIAKLSTCAFDSFSNVRGERPSRLVRTNRSI